MVEISGGISQRAESDRAGSAKPSLSTAEFDRYASEARPPLEGVLVRGARNAVRRERVAPETEPPPSAPPGPPPPPWGGSLLPLGRGGPEPRTLRSARSNENPERERSAMNTLVLIIAGSLLTIIAERAGYEYTIRPIDELDELDELDRATDSTSPDL